MRRVYGPVDYMNENAYKHLPPVREALFKEDYKLAASQRWLYSGYFLERGTTFICQDLA